MKLEMIKAQNSHLAQIVAIEKENFPDYWAESLLAGKIEDTSVRFFVALDESDRERVLGYCILQELKPEAELLKIAVKKTRQGMGIGTVLLKKLLDDLECAGMESVFLEVRVSNQSGISLYKNLGFREIGMRKEYYKNNLEDALLMQKRFGNDNFSN